MQSPFPLRFLKPTPNHNFTISELVMESFGVLMLVVAGGLSVINYNQGNLDLVGVALAHMFILSFMIWAGAACCGAHYNGAVTIACMISRNIGMLKGCFYLLAQFAGSLMGGLFLEVYSASFLGKTAFKDKLGYPHCNLTDWGIGACIWSELIFTFLLVFMVYATAIPMTPVDGNEAIKGRYARPQNNVFALTIGGALGIANLCIGPITGAALNPWRVVGPAMVSGELFTGEFWYGFVYYLICPLAGALCGIVAYFSFMVDPYTKLAENDDEEHEDVVALTDEQNRTNVAN